MISFILPEIKGEPPHLDLLNMTVAGQDLLPLLDDSECPELFPPELSSDPARGNVGDGGLIDERDDAVQPSLSLQYHLTLLDPPASKESPPLARSLSDDVRWTGGLVSFPVLDLALLGAVGDLLTGTTLQLILGFLAEVAGSHLSP